MDYACYQCSNNTIAGDALMETNYTNKVICKVYLCKYCLDKLIDYENKNEKIVYKKE